MEAIITFLGIIVIYIAIFSLCPLLEEIGCILAILLFLFFTTYIVKNYELAFYIGIK